MIVSGPSLIISARVAVALEPGVDDVEARVRRDGVALDPEVGEVVADLHRLAAWYRTRASAPDPPRVDAPAEARPPSPTMLTAADAATHLGVSGRRVRQRLAAGTLPGIRVAGRWWVDPAAVNGARGG